MSKPLKRTYSGYAQDAAALLGGLIRIARKSRKLTAQNLADRAGISRGLLQRIEKGDLKCELGAVFEVATIVGIRLFDDDEADLKGSLRQVENHMVLLPKRIRTQNKSVQDDF